MVITAGGALLGWIGGGMIVTDPALPPELLNAVPHAKYLVAFVGAALVIIIGKLLAARKAAQPAADLAAAAALGEHGLKYLDVAIMGAVALGRHATPLLVAGDGADHPLTGVELAPSSSVTMRPPSMVEIWWLKNEL